MPIVTKKTNSTTSATARVSDNKQSATSRRIRRKFFKNDQTYLPGIVDGKMDGYFIQWATRDNVNKNPEQYEDFELLKIKDLSVGYSSKVSRSPDSTVIRGDMIALKMPLDIYSEYKKENQIASDEQINVIKKRKRGDILHNNEDLIVTDFKYEKRIIKNL